MSDNETIRQQVTGHPVVLYMKGSPQFPMCGFSANATQILKLCGVAQPFTVDVLQDPEIRQASGKPRAGLITISGELHANDGGYELGVHDDGLGPDKLGVELGFAVVKQHGNHFLQIRMQFIQRRALAVRTGEAGHMAHVEVGIGAALDYGGVSVHGL